MALSDREQRLLDEMEQHLYRSEADVVSAPKSPTATLSARHIVIGVLLIALGVVGLITGVSTKSIPIGLVGFVVMVVGATWALRPREATSAKGKRDTSGRVGPAKARQSPKASFQERMNERWDRRNNQ